MTVFRRSPSRLRAAAFEVFEVAGKPVGGDGAAVDGVVVRGVGIEHGRHGGGADAVTGEGWQRGVVADGAIDDLRLDGDDVQR